MMDLSQYSSQLVDRLRNRGVDSKECIYRLERLRDAESLPSEYLKGISRRYLDLTHEINSFLFLCDYGVTQLSSDKGHKAGTDIIMENYQIECVCASIGDTPDISGFTEVCVKNTLDKGLIDYSQRERFIQSRLTSILSSKKDFFINHCISGTISRDQPYIVFISLGELAYDYFAGENGFELTGILFGKGKPFMRIDSLGNIIGSGYSSNKDIQKEKKNGATTIPCQLFYDHNYNCISAILFSEACLEDYNSSNTWLFINPNADVKINHSDFSGIGYWDVNDKEEYAFHENGRKPDAADLIVETAINEL